MGSVTVNPNPVLHQLTPRNSIGADSSLDLKAPTSYDRYVSRRRSSAISTADRFELFKRQISSLSHFSVTWHNISFEVQPKIYQKFYKRPAMLLRDLTGQARSGQLVGLMGPSGCGKTTLLTCIAQRAVNGTMTGSVYIKGRNKVKIAMVPHHDRLYEHFTVRETLTYASYLKVSQSYLHLRHHSSLGFNRSSSFIGVLLESKFHGEGTRDEH